MATDPATVEFLLGQMAGAGAVSARKMFGEYAIYLGGKLVALVCDGRLFLKPVPQARALLADPQEAPPYPGARPHLVVEDELDDPELMARLVLAVEAALPEPKPKKPKPTKTRRT
jgi:TfoX/Sxy family transcriptional regulator of competence genes